MEIEDILFRPPGRPSTKPLVRYKSFRYQAASWSKSRRVVAKVEHHPGELFPRIGFIVTNMTLPSSSLVRFYNKRGTAEQWVKEGKQATHWTWLSCHRFRANEVRLQLSVLAYNLENLWRRLGLPQRIKSWSLTSLQRRADGWSSMLATTGCCWPRGTSTGSCSARCWGGSGRYLCREASADGPDKAAYAGCRGSAREGFCQKALCVC